ncbi:MAG: hypothetical protein IT431_10395 [Phycisphaerales bacterium]|nr:hypothetical protein [Phycisphaerales bacterium]
MPRHLLTRAVALAFLTTGACAQCDEGWDDRFTAAGVRFPLTSVAVTELNGRPAIFGGGRIDSYYWYDQEQGVACWDGQAWGYSPGGLEAGEYYTPRFSGDAARAVVYAAGGEMTVGGQDMSPIARWDGAEWVNIGSPFEASLIAPGPLDGHDSLAVLTGGLVDDAATVVLRRDGQWHTLGSFTPWQAVNAMVWADLGHGEQLHVFGWFDDIDGQAIERAATWDGQAWQPFGGGVDMPILAAVPYNMGAGSGVMLLGYTEWRFFDGGAWQAGSLEGGPEYSQFLARATLAGEDVLLIHGPVSEPGPIRMWTWNGHDWTLLPGEFNGRIDAACVADLGDGPLLHAFGQFTMVDDQFRLGGAAFDGRRWRPLANADPGTVTGVNALLAVGDEGGPALGNRVFALGGLFRSWHWLGAVAEWDGAAWRSLGLDWDGAATAYHPPILIADLGEGPRLIVGGGWGWTDEFQGLTIAAWDGHAWQSLDPLWQINGLAALAVFDDGAGPRLYAAGSARFDDGTSRGLFRFVGDRWEPAMPPGVDVQYITVMDDGSGPGLYACVSRGFDFGDGPIGPVVRWTADGWEQVGNTLTDMGQIGEATFLEQVEFTGRRTIAVQGIFQVEGGWWPSTQFAVLDDGVWRREFDYLPHHVWELRSFETPGGLVTVINNFDRDYPENIDIYEHGEWRTLPGEFDQYVRTLAFAEQDGQQTFYAVGGFESVGGVPSHRFARYGCPPCPADFDADGDADEMDVAAFLDLWTTGNPAADANADGWIDTRDMVAYLNTWNAGCP